MSVLRPPFIEIDAAPRPSGAARVTALREIPPVETSPPAMTPAGENLCPRCNRTISPTGSQAPGDSHPCAPQKSSDSAIDAFVEAFVALRP